MDSVRVLRYINIATMLLVAFFNLVDCVIEQSGISQYLAYVAPFILVAAILGVARNYKINAIIYAVAGLAIGVTSSKGNFSGAIFLIFSIYIFNKPLTNYIILSCCCAALATRYFFLGYTIPDTLNLFIGYAFTFGVYFILMHPKPAPKPVISLIDETDLETVRLIYLGLKPKEIAFEEGVTPSAISKRIDRIKKKYECSDNYELFRKFENMGVLIPKSDISD